MYSDDLATEILQMFKERCSGVKAEVGMHACLAAAMALARVSGIRLRVDIRWPAPAKKSTTKDGE